MAADLHEFIVEHQLENPIIVGHSMGGKVVMQFAMTYPEAFSKMVVSVGLMTPEEWPLLKSKNEREPL